jgi:hypothetical protein
VLPVKGINLWQIGLYFDLIGTGEHYQHSLFYSDNHNIGGEMEIVRVRDAFRCKFLEARTAILCS